MTPHRLGLLLLFIATLAWSTSGLFARAITETLMTVLVWRGLFAGAGMLVVLTALHGTQALKGFATMGRVGWLYAAISTVGILTYISALRLTSIAHVAIIYAAMPFVTAGVAWVMLRQKPSRTAILASLTAFAGALLMVGLGGEGTLLGDFLALLMVLSMALLTVIARKHPQMPALPAGATSVALSVLICLPFASPTLPPPDQLWLLAGFGLINSTLGYTLFVIGSQRVAPIETALLGALEAPITPLWVWLVFAETPTLPTFAGGTLVIASVIWYIARQYRLDPAP